MSDTHRQVQMNRWPEEAGGEKEEWGKGQKNKVEEIKKRDSRVKSRAGDWKTLRGNVLCVMTPDERLLAREHSGKTVNKVQRVSQLGFHGYRCASAGLTPNLNPGVCMWRGQTLRLWTEDTHLNMDMGSVTQIHTPTQKPGNTPTTVDMSWLSPATDTDNQGNTRFRISP